MGIKNNLAAVISVFICLSVVLAGSGCEVVQTIDSLNGILEEQPPDPEAGMLLNAEFAFYQENYTLAEDLYSKVLNTSKKRIHQNHARYGLACVGISTARNTTELKEAFELLDKWQEPKAETLGYAENPKMIAVALNRKQDIFQLKPEIRYVTTAKEGELLRKNQQEIADLRATIEKLEHQISVLEAIDQEIQEKRKPI